MVAQDGDDPRLRALFLTGLGSKVTEELLFELFLQAGPLESIHIPKDPKTKKRKNFGFVNFKHAISVDYTIKLLDGLLLFGEPISLQRKDGGGGESQQNQILPMHQSAAGGYQTSQYAAFQGRGGGHSTPTHRGYPPQQHYSAPPIQYDGGRSHQYQRSYSNHEQASYSPQPRGNDYHDNNHYQSRSNHWQQGQQSWPPQHASSPQQYSYDNSSHDYGRKRTHSHASPAQSPYGGGSGSAYDSLMSRTQRGITRGRPHYPG